MDPSLSRIRCSPMMVGGMIDTGPVPSSVRWAIVVCTERSDSLLLTEEGPDGPGAEYGSSVTGPGAPPYPCVPLSC